MTHEIDAGAIYSTVMMLRDSSKKPIIIIEGDTDSRYLSPHLNAKNVEVVIAHGKANLIGCFERMKVRPIPNCIGISDSDFDSIRQINHAVSDVVFTDYHDIEMHAFKSSALDRVLREYGSETKIKALGSDIRKTILQKTRPIGILRLLSHIEKYQLIFKGVKIENFVNRNTLEVDRKEMIRRVLLNTKRSPISAIELEKKLESMENDDFPLENICCGHDVTCMLAISLKNLIGTLDSKMAEHINIERLLRIAFSAQDLQSINIYHSLLAWQNRHGFQPIFTSQLSDL